MKIVASTKMNRAQKAMTESRAYGQASNKVFEEAETKPEEGKKTLLVIASSDKGLCGGIHSGLTRATRRMLIDDPELEIAIIGEKCKAQVGRSNGKNVVLSFASIGKDIPTFADAQAIADQLTMLRTDYASIKILYNKYINASSYEPTQIEAYAEEAITNSANFAAFEIDDEVLSNMREYTLANSLYWALAEGHACEQAARRNAMDVSVKVVQCSATISDVLLPECLKERWRHDQQILNPLQQDTSSRHYRRVGGDHYWCYSFGRYVGKEYWRRIERAVHTTSQSRSLLLQTKFVELALSAVTFLLTELSSETCQIRGSSSSTVCVATLMLTTAKANSRLKLMGYVSRY
jgi:F-type H+-transporting ATPase subunit gamma